MGAAPGAADAGALQVRPAAVQVSQAVTLSVSFAAPAGPDRAVERLPQGTRHAAVRGAAAAAAGLLDVDLLLPGGLRVSPGLALLPAGDYPPGRAAPRYSERMS